MLRHKWFVFIECCKLGIPLRGLWHDWSKFLPWEWFPYAEYFYGEETPKKPKTGYFHKMGRDDQFDFAWLLHQKRNKHHWQWWTLPEDCGKVKILPMPDVYRKEMLADWRGAGKAQGYGDNTSVWYEANKDKMQLHPETRKWIEKQLGL